MARFDPYWSYGKSIILETNEYWSYGKSVAFLEVAPPVGLPIPVAMHYYRNVRET